ncbi:NEDD8-activating enzyme E1 catalytic subunit-like isoform X1 [Acropora millepora]|uniref:NEDD8-activating enzyme E1 catalytic subunit-like isoform X1 n=1 Tax=Acropora millepora TaxID=45264 RepID=UPI001CF5BFE9|nr:NEDD8-activating enzyme E1 catalytic subunit-like isoform X1 [Acropora millepora]
MEVEEQCSESAMFVENKADDWSGRWSHIQKLLMRSGPLAHQDFEPGPQVLEFMLESAKILVIGAGGLGCELLKDLALCGFRYIDVIDMDTIDVSNLNRQFLFRPKDIGRAKAEIAAEFVNSRIAGCKVTPHFKKIQDFDADFYRGFHLIVCGLDSIIARRWMNGMVLSLLEYDDDGILDQTSIIPVVDGGTEGFKGNARVIIPGLTACIECTLDLYPPQVNFPLCTIAHTPRLPEHCIEYAKVLVWPQEHPFGVGVPVDGDDPAHVQWIFQKAKERAYNYSIQGLTYRLTQGVVKHIIPAVASTNALIAAACALEVFKLVSSCCNPLNNYMVFNDTDGLYTYTFEAEKKEDCAACSQRPQVLTFPDDATLKSVIHFLNDSPTYQMKAPSLTTMVDGKNKTLYIQSVKSLEEKTRHNLPKKLKDIGLVDGQEIVVADSTTPKAIICKIQFASSME